MPSTHDLIAAIYAATLSPDDFTRTFDRLDSLLFLGEDRPADEREGESRLCETALSHIAMARSIQERIGRARTYEQKLTSILESVPNPSYVITRSESVLAANGVARAKYGPTPATLKDLAAVDDVHRQVRDFLRKGEVSRPLAVSGHGDRPRKSQTSVLVNRIDASLTGAPESLFLLSIVDIGFDGETTELFRATYGLTQAETEVAVLLASGLRLSDIAAERRVSLETVRTQIKVIKAKTSARDLPGLVRLLCGFTASVLGPGGGEEAAAATGRTTPLKARRQIALRDGRKLDYLEQGARDGLPVILLHNLPYGAELPAAAIRQAHADNLRIVAPFRPGFGNSDPIAGIDGDTLLTAVAGDIRELMQRLGMERAAVVSHSSGAAFALRFARLFPDAVSRLIGVSRAPIWRDEWMAQTPARQRFMLRLAKHSPQLLPVVSWAMVSCMESRYASEFVTYNCKDGKADSAALQQNPEIIGLIANGSVDALRNGVDCVGRECRILLDDFSAEARESPHKFHILHGSDDSIIHISQSYAFAEAVPGTQIEAVEGAGQLLFYSHWQHVLAAIKRGNASAAAKSARPEAPSP